MKNKDLEHIISKKMEGFKPTPPPMVWEEVKQSIPPKKVIPWKPIIVFSSVLIIMSAVILWKTYSTQTDSKTPVSTSTNTVPHVQVQPEAGNLTSDSSSISTGDMVKKNEHLPFIKSKKTSNKDPLSPIIDKLAPSKHSSDNLEKGEKKKTHKTVRYIEVDTIYLEEHIYE